MTDPTPEALRTALTDADSMPIMMETHSSGWKWALPMWLFRPHEAQARRNHSQSLDRLRERGGLTPTEALAILENRRYGPSNEPYAPALSALIVKLSAALASPPVAEETDETLPPMRGTPVQVQRQRVTGVVEGKPSPYHEAAWEPPPARQCLCTVETICEMHTPEPLTLGDEPGRIPPAPAVEELPQYDERDPEFVGRMAERLEAASSDGPKLIGQEVGYIVSLLNAYAESLPANPPGEPQPPPSPGNEPLANALARVPMHGRLVKPAGPYVLIQDLAPWLLTSAGFVADEPQPRSPARDA